MNRADNSPSLAQANARRHQAALAAAHHAIEQLRRERKPVNYAAVAHAAGVSRTWLYSQDQIRDLISDLRKHEPPAAALTAQRASTSSLRQRLDTARDYLRLVGLEHFARAAKEAAYHVRFPP